MIQETLSKLFESRSFLGLLFILLGYAGCWTIYIAFGFLVNKIRQPLLWYLERGFFMGWFCLLLKGFLPIIFFQIGILAGFIFIFRSSEIKWKWAVLTAALVDGMALTSDILILEPLVKLPGGAVFILKTVPGVLTGTLIEALLPGIAILIICGVKKWKIAKFKNS